MYPKIAALLVLSIFVFVPAKASGVTYNFNFNHGPQSTASSSEASTPFNSTPKKPATQILFNVDSDMKVYLDNKVIKEPINGLHEIKPGPHLLTLVKPGHGQVEKNIVAPESEVTIINAISPHSGEK